MGVNEASELQRPDEIEPGEAFETWLDEEIGAMGTGALAELLREYMLTDPGVEARWQHEEARRSAEDLADWQANQRRE